MKPCTCYRI